MPDQELAIFTICSNNYVAMADNFLTSAAQHHPEAKLYLCLADEMLEKPGFYPETATLVPARTLGIPGFEAFAFRYSIMEFNTAVKPFMIRHLLASGHRAVLYFDPDIEIFRPLDEVTGPLRDGASFVLTPHICRPAEGEAFPTDVGVLEAGIYNLGFLGVGNTPETDEVLRWWSRRLQYWCIDDQPNGVFVDQKFMDLVPGFAPNHRILRDPSLNVAYWNLPQRRLERAGGGWQVDGKPLGFFHFSGFDPHRIGRLSKYTERFWEARDGIAPDLAALMAHYGQRLLARGHGSVPAGLYAYGRFASGARVTEFVRQAFREDHLLWVGNPFETFEEYLALPAAERWEGAAGACVTNAMRRLRVKGPWLQQTFHPGQPGAARGFVDWYLNHAEGLLGDPRLVEPVAERLGTASRPRRRPPASHGEADVDVVGYLRLALGLGEAGRLTLRALALTGLAARGLPTALNSNSASVDGSCETLFAQRGTAPVTVFNINPDQIDPVLAEFGPRLRPDAYRIMVPFWELARMPEAWRAGFERMDEIWAPTRFIQTALARSLDRPVVRMPLMLEFEPPAAMTRERFGLPEDRFLFFFAFDYFSSLARKNPLAVIEAFERAFGRGGRDGRAVLVLKTLNAKIVPEQGRALRERLADTVDVVLIEQNLPRNETLGLVAVCDAVVSLHRAEGLGLLVAEAMALGKPVIATDYSATTELVSPRTGFPVDYRLVPVAAGEYGFPEGQHWADADIDHAAWQMRAVLAGGEPVARRVAAARAHLEAVHGASAVAARQRARLRQIGITAKAGAA